MTRQTGEHAESPKRRRHFRFQLSTILVLIAIAAWAMATRPYFVDRVEVTQVNLGPNIADTIVIRHPPNPHLVWPALALVALVTWKAGWAVHSGAKRQSPRSPANLTPTDL